MNISKLEKEVNDFWFQDNSFIKSNQNKLKKFIFFEGPPFATGLPHYGHILGGFIKDTICRAACQNGFSVDRNVSWDCHGLPIEFEIEKELGIKTKKEILEYGIDNYNKSCENIVLKYADQWKTIINRLGRWINWENNIKTMDFEYMNTVWSIFSKIYNKNLIYQDFKVMPYSNACTTPLSNFEASSNYQNVTDKTVIVEFKIKNRENEYFLVWTTTPWTLPANQALCININLEYVTVKSLSNNKIYIIAKNLVQHVFNKAKKEYEIINTLFGSDLIGLAYENLFDSSKIYSVFADNFVNDSSGTGIVHLAPGFGEDDFRVCKNNNINDIIIHINESGIFTNDVFPYLLSGLNIKDSIKQIIKLLKESLFDIFDFTHSYPFCWRSDTPLIYKAVSSWFLKVSDIKDNLVENNLKINWIPQNIRDGRFHNWLNNAKDWCLTRNRYWGTPIPIWKSECGKIIVVSNSAELEELAGLPNGSIINLHRDHIDHIIIIKDGIKYKREEYVLDCWFDSGCIPYVLQKSFNPIDTSADFIAEGLDQTRGWFYTLLVISTCLNNQPVFKNVIVNGLVLASDGKKMSKRHKNYPDPIDIVNKYGSDALRLYLVTSVASKAENIKFNEIEVKGIMQNFILPLFNSFAFYFEYEEKFKIKNKDIIFEESTNPLDHWCIDITHIFVNKLKKLYLSYTLQPIYNLLTEYIDMLNNYYIRLNRENLKNNTISIAIFKYILQICILHLAPILPFLTEYFNLKFNNLNSIHCQEFYIRNIDWLKSDYILESKYLIKIILMINSLRGNLPRKRPIKYAVIKALPQIYKLLNTDYMKQFLEKETNIIELDIQLYVPTIKIYSIKPNYKILGSRCKILEKYIKLINQENIKDLLNNGFIIVNDNEIKLSDVLIDEHISSENSLVSAENDELQLSISLNLIQDEDSDKIYISKVLAREFQKLRKENGLHPWDPVNLGYISSYNLENKALDIILKSTEYIPNKMLTLPDKIISSKIIKILDFQFQIIIF